MKLNKTLILLLVVPLLFALLQSSCCTGNPEPDPQTGKIAFTFEHTVNGFPVDYDTMIYQNEAGNPYLVDNIQYFVSDFKLWQKGNYQLLDGWEDIHYVDTDIPGTWQYKPADDIDSGTYDSITFVFGITGEKNKSFMFVNPPESYMFWPEYLGGGYHYLKLNGKWKDPQQVVRPFNFHLGIGQQYNDDGEITGFIQNWFTVNLPGSAILVSTGATTQVTIVMNVEQWFKEPNVWDFNHWGGDIMENQEAMHTAVENGHNVFTIKTE